MKRFFTKATKPFTAPLQTSSSTTDRQRDVSINPPRLSNATLHQHTTNLQPKYVVPPVPHPCPYSHLALLVSSQGLLIRPHFADPDAPPSLSYIRISWGKGGSIEELQASTDEDLPWSEAVIVYGIVGIVELFSCSYLLVVSSRVEVATVLDPTHLVYGVKGVIDVPLVEDRARIALNTLAARNAAASRPSLLYNSTRPQESSAEFDDDELSRSQELPRKTKVQFLSESPPSRPSLDLSQTTNSTIGNSILRPSSAQSTASDSSTPSSEGSAPSAPVFKTLATRLSFWSRLSKRTSTTPVESEFPLLTEPLTPKEEGEVLDKLMNDKREQSGEVIETILASTAPPPPTVEEKHSELEVKVVREIIREYTKGGMFFAHTFDITRSLQHKQEQVLKLQKQHDLLAGLGALPADSDKTIQDSPLSPMPGKVIPLAEPSLALPLWRRVDNRFWWNEWMSKPFIEAGAHPYILPIMQGYCQATQFSITADQITENQDSLVDYIIISRRSRYRPGLRYQRRGIDDEAHVANFVETETIMRVEREGKENVFAYVQIRGSIPLFWTQNGYGLKPPPVLSSDRTHAQNLDALKRHFTRTVPVYGHLSCVNLAEQHGKEGAITQAYREFMQEANMKDAQYFEYDFHTETRGMKYENISNLIESMDKTFDGQGYFWISDNVAFSQQKGVFRVNCIDCLDRTNVVQSAFARYVMNKQLGAVALLNPSTANRTDADLAFNDVWANNGDAISRAYAGTSALKGDFTRTGKRDLSGMLNDGVNSLARMYTATFGDWFSQAVIDFMLGNRTITVFSEFLLKLKSTDPRDLIRLSRIRAEAISTSVSRVLPEGERLLSGWTLFSPEELNTKVGLKFEEKVLLLSAKAIYIVSYDYTLEKVKLYTRVPLGDIVSISKGAYILSPLEESSCDPEQNTGFVITWLSSNQESRVTSYSVRNSIMGVPPSPAAFAPTFAFNTALAKSNATLSRPSAFVNNLAKDSINNINTAMNNLGSKIRTQTPALSRILAGAPPPTVEAAGGTASVSASSNSPFTYTFAAFKVLPIDPARTGSRIHHRHGSSGMSAAAIPEAMSRASSSGGDDPGGYLDDGENYGGASTCREVADWIVAKIWRACEDVGGGSGAGVGLGYNTARGRTVRSSDNFVKEEDVVSLAEAQRMTSVYAKMEYGVKRLLWLGS
ncbi:hypothetical protein CVT24_006784 [Panaeolus cyanescens]|uniref:SAC domain-containing protein n=1 Tax=Panaeolus cyanescens TaxID=181874 RepID=A0A409VBF0_9AGAR|nr:hypothetical protein CVT24_006784 [Panaeolus cyanescens]